MKEFVKSLFAGALILLCSASADALPLVWRADWPDAKPVETLVHRGTDIELQPLWRINKEPADTNGWTFTTFCQTNAVGPWFGPLPGAFFSHTNDVGATFYNVMVRAETPGGAVNYTAFARLRMLDSPGFAPGQLPLPAKSIDFADVEAFNAPWLLPGATNDIGTIKVELGSLSNNVSTLSDTKADRSELATVATSGSYNDLSNKPQINGVSLTGNKTGADLGLLDLAGGTMTGPIHMGDNFLKWRDGDLIYWLSAYGLYIWDDGDDVTHSPSYIIDFPMASGTLALREDIPAVPPWAMNPSKPTYTYAEITGKPTFAAIATSGSYNDLTDKPTIPSPTAPVASATLAWQSNGSAIVVSVAAGGTLSATLTDWIEGQSQTALITLAAGASVSSEVKLVGYGTWPTGGQFLASATRVGNNIYVTPIVLVN